MVLCYYYCCYCCYYCYYCLCYCCCYCCDHCSHCFRYCSCYCYYCCDCFYVVIIVVVSVDMFVNVAFFIVKQIPPKMIIVDIVNWCYCSVCYCNLTFLLVFNKPLIEVVVLFSLLLLLLLLLFCCCCCSSSSSCFRFVVVIVNGTLGVIVNVIFVVNWSNNSHDNIITLNC